MRKANSISSRRSHWRSSPSDRASFQILWAHTPGLLRDQRNQIIRVQAITSTATQITPSRVLAYMDQLLFLIIQACIRTVPGTITEANRIATIPKSRYSPSQISLVTHMKRMMSNRTIRNSKQCSSSKTIHGCKCRDFLKSMPVYQQTSVIAQSI